MFDSDTEKEVGVEKTKNNVTGIDSKTSKQTAVTSKLDVENIISNNSWYATCAISR